jgi:hypothetical protein
MWCCPNIRCRRFVRRCADSKDSQTPAYDGPGEGQNARRLSVRAPEVQTYVIQRARHRSDSRGRFVRASARIFLETDEQGHVRRRIGMGIPRPLPTWFAPAERAYTLFLRRARGLAERTVSRRAWQLNQNAEFLERNGVRAMTDIQPAQIQQFFTQLERQKPAKRLTNGVTLRSFLRWAYGESGLPIDLSAGDHRSSLPPGRDTRCADG